MVRVKEIMNKAMAVDGDVTVKEAAKIMSEKRIGSLIVLKKDSLVGIITESDIMKALDKLNSKVSNIMSRNVITIEESDTIDEAALLMSQNKIKKLPVVKDDKLVGIITATDLIANSDALNEPFFFD